MTIRTDDVVPTDTAPPVIEQEEPGGGKTNLSAPHNVPDGSEVWNVAGTYYLVWVVDEIQPPVYIAYTVEPDALQQVFPGTPRTDRALTAAQFAAVGAVTMGNSTRLLNTDTDPYQQFVDMFDSVSATQPWLRDPEILAITVAAVLEGRPVRQDELSGTQWWKDHSQAEREWLSLNASDPSTANKRLQDNRLKTRDTLAQMGVTHVPLELIRHLADNLTMGVWSQTYVNTQINRLADPYYPGKVDPQLRKLLDGPVDSTNQGESTVHDLLMTWLGPKHGSRSAEWTERWAGRIRNDPDAQDNLVGLLRQQRLRLFPNFTHPDTTYEDIADPIRGQYQQIWGRDPDEMSPLFTSLLRINDDQKIESTLLKEGLAQGVDRVVGDLTRDMLRSFGQ